MVALIAVALVLCAVLLVFGFLAPRASRRAQKRMDRGAQQAAAKAGSEPQPIRGLAERSLELTQHAADRTTEAGRHERQNAERTRR